VFAYHLVVFCLDKLFLAFTNGRFSYVLEKLWRHLVKQNAVWVLVGRGVVLLSRRQHTMQDPNTNDSKKDAREDDAQEITRKDEANTDEGKQDAQKDKAKKDARKDEAKKDAWKDEAKKDASMTDLMKREVLEWLQKMHDWACSNFGVRDRARAIDDYAKKACGLTVTTVTQVSHQELSGTVYNMESTCHGIAYTSSWLSTLRL